MTDVPWNRDAEVAVIAACLQDTDALAEVVETLRPDHFYAPAHRLIFEAARDLFSKGEGADTITVAEALDVAGKLEQAGGKKGLIDLVTAHPFAFDAPRHARIVRERALLRRLIEAAAGIHAVAMSKPENVAEALDRCEALVLAVREDGKSEDAARVYDDLSAVMEMIERRQEVGDEMRGVPTGFGDFDRMTTGLLPGQFILLGARPAMGKTGWLLNVGLNAARLGYSVLHYSLEMNRAEMVERALSAVSGVALDRIRKGSLRERDWEALSGALAVLGDVNYRIAAPSSLSYMELRAQTRRLKAKHGLDLVVIDYIGLMNTPPGENRNQEISLLSRSLKMLARDLDCPVLAASQLNRQLELRADKRPTLSDLRESGSLEQDADLVAFLYRDHVYNQEADPTRAELIVAKHRNGPTGTMPLHFNAELVRFGSRLEYGVPA